MCWLVESVISGICRELKSSCEGLLCLLTYNTQRRTSGCSRTLPVVVCHCDFRVVVFLRVLAESRFQKWCSRLVIRLTASAPPCEEAPHRCSIMLELLRGGYIARSCGIPSCSLSFKIQEAAVAGPKFVNTLFNYVERYWTCTFEHGDVFISCLCVVVW